MKLLYLNSAHKLLEVKVYHFFADIFKINQGSKLFKRLSRVLFNVRGDEREGHFLRPPMDAQNTRKIVSQTLEPPMTP